MNMLDEGIDAVQRERLMARKVHFRQIGVEIGRSGMKDRNEIILRLHPLRCPTFFTQDNDFSHPRLRHPRYCLVYLDVFYEVADSIRRFLRHPAFRTKAQPMGKVVRLRHSGITHWQVGKASEHVIAWR